MDDALGPPTGGDPAKRLARRATLKLLGLALTGAATGATLADATAQAQAGRARPAVPSSRQGRAWTLRPLAAGTSPRTFDAATFAALGALVNAILPDTDTPGARTAGVHWYLDDVAATDTSLATRLRSGLQRLNARALATHDRPFAELSEPQQAALLAPYAQHAAGSVALDAGASAQPDALTPDDRGFFALMKAQTIDAYYKSEMGQIGELEWVGHEFHDTFPGVCSHADALTHARPQWPTRRA